MKRKNIIYKLWAMLISLGYKQLEVCEYKEIKNSLLVHLGVDSMGLMQLMVMAECDFGVEWKMHKVSIATLSTLGAIADYLSTELSHEAAPVVTLREEAVKVGYYSEV